MGDPEQLKLVRWPAARCWACSSPTPTAVLLACAQIMDTDPYFWSQDNGAGAPVHFAATYKQLDMVR